MQLLLSLNWDDVIDSFVEQKSGLWQFVLYACVYDFLRKYLFFTFIMLAKRDGEFQQPQAAVLLNPPLTVVQTYPTIFNKNTHFCTLSRLFSLWTIFSPFFFTKIDFIFELNRIIVYGKYFTLTRRLVINDCTPHGEKNTVAFSRHI